MEPERTADPAAAMKGRHFVDEVSRTTMSVGLRGRGDGVLGSSELASAVRVSTSMEGGPPEILVTPLSLMADDRWEALTGPTGTGSRGVA